ncbi:MAG: hypothetical protein J6Q89_04355 [Clostridia bacterium]|nr:hypothetical protein [Clostridia bacterium]
MKKILAFLLATTLLCAMFVLPSAAADNINYEEEFEFAKRAPSIDGVVKPGEYGVTPIHRYSESKSQFTQGDDHDDYNNWDFSFYGVWDKDYVYMAWVVESAVHAGMPEEDQNADGVYDDADTVYMWPYSCVQFIFTPGKPASGSGRFQTSAWSGDYLEVGLGLSADGNQIRVPWSKPNNATALNVNDWDAAIVRDDANKTTTYEVRIPWSKSGLTEAGNGAQFGLTYAVAAQEHYDTKKGMIEWQDAILGTKNADNAAVITLTGNEDIQIEQIAPVNPDAKEEGELPAEAEGKVQLVIDGVNTSITSEKAYLYTDPAKVASNNNNWATSILLAPVEGQEGQYTIVEKQTGNGEAFSFTTEDTTGMIAFSVHSAGEDGSEGKARRDAVDALVEGDILGLFGVDFDKADTLYSNSMFYVISSSAGEESTDESSEEESSEASSEVSSEASSEVSSTVESSVGITSDAEDEGGLGAWLWVIIGGAVVVLGAVAAIVLKKKKA